MSDSLSVSRDPSKEQQTADDERRATEHSSLPLVEIYSKPDCCLCDEAKRVLLNVRETLPFHLREIDISQDLSLFEKYKEQIPLIFINGRMAFKFKVSEEELKKKLKVEIASPL